MGDHIHHFTVTYAVPDTDYLQHHGYPKAYMDDVADEIRDELQEAVRETMSDPWWKDMGVTFI